jgi:tetratricopeptide (TPR) repeat protein
MIWVTNEDREFAKNLLSGKEFNSHRYIVLFAGAQYALRSYPNFGKAIAKISKEKKLSVVALGSKEDYEINQTNLNDIEGSTLNLSGKTTLRQAAAIIENAVFAVGAETGLAHIACAVETPNIILLGGGHFGRFMPYSNLTSVVALPLDCYKCDWKCEFNHAYCIKDVDYKTIEEAVSKTIINRSDKTRVFIQTNYLPQINANSPGWYLDNELLSNKDVEIIEVHFVISIEEIEELIVNKKYEEALNNLLGLLNNDEVDLNVLNNIAVIQILTKRWVDASETLKYIIEMDPDNQVALENIKYLEQQLVYHKIILDSEELIEHQKLTEAKKLLREILEYEPEHIDALNNLAVVEIYEGDFSAAEEVLCKVLELNPEDEIATDNFSYLNELLKASDNENYGRKETHNETESANNNTLHKNETLLSIVIQGRNDSYMGNFEWRLSTNINKLAQNIVNLGIQGKVQIILVDWGSEEPLSKVLTLSDEAINILDVIYVDKFVADKFNKDSEYSMVHAINTGIRRASGSYIMFCDGDTYIPNESLKKIVELISESTKSGFVPNRSLLMASRYHIPKSFQQSNPSLDEIDNFIKKNQFNLSHDKINTTEFTGTATAYLLPRKIWYECTGFNEALIYWGWFDIDLFHRIKLKYDTYDFEDIGMPFYHLEHYSNSNNRNMQAENPRKINQGIIPASFAINSKDWGLLNEHLSITKIIREKQKIFNSELNNIIPPEIKDDEFYEEIVKLTKSKEIRTVLEIGSSAGGGSTEAFVKGLNQNPNNPILFCMEISSTRFAELKKRYENDNFVKCYNVSSVAIDDFPSNDEVIEFYHARNTSINKYTVEQVISWLDQDIEYIKKSGVYEDGIQIIREDNNIQNFDLVLIDGSEFTGSIELDKVYGAKYILLDDINAFKNYDSYQRLKKDANYNLIKENWNTRNGYAIFKFNDNELPVHFFTIVLNGEPFIK